LAVARFTGRIARCSVVLGRWLSSGNYRVDLVFATDALSLDAGWYWRRCSVCWSRAFR
jgi:hypothetical protein